MNLLVRLIAHRDHEARQLADLAEGARRRTGEIETGARGRRDRPRVHPVCWMRAGRIGRGSSDRPPQDGRELTASRVPRAHEQGSTGSHPPTRRQVRQRLSQQMHVPAATVATRFRPVDHPHRLEHVEVVGEQVRLDPDQPPQLNWCPIGRQQLVHDRQPHRIT